jgi:peptidoglycan/LPS O-acetylase OafA/YrhL
MTLLKKMKHCTHKVKSPPVSSSSGYTRNFSSLAGLIVLILPKCPACLVSYTSAMTLCGSTTLVAYVTHETDIKAYLALALGLMIVGSILFAFRRGRRVHLALALALGGESLLGVSLLLNESLPYYYTGATLLVLATLLLGGSFHWKKLKSQLWEMRIKPWLPIRNP